MNKAQLIEVIAQKANISKVQAELAINTLTRTITETINGGGEVTITGFGSFTAKEHKSRTVANPRNPSETINVPPTKVAKFKAGKNLKDTLKGRLAPKPETPAPAPAAEPETPAPTPAPESETPSEPQSPSSEQ